MKRLTVVGERTVRVQHTWPIQLTDNFFILLEKYIIFFLNFSPGQVSTLILRHFFLYHHLLPILGNFLHKLLIVCFILTWSFFNYLLFLELLLHFVHHLYQLFLWHRIILHFIGIFTALFNAWLYFVLAGLPIFFGLLANTFERTKATIAEHEIEDPVVSVLSVKRTVHLPQKRQISTTILAGLKINIRSIKPSGFSSKVGYIDCFGWRLIRLPTEIAKINFVFDVVQVNCWIFLHYINNILTISLNLLINTLEHSLIMETTIHT